MNLNTNIFKEGFVKCAVNECGGSLHPLVFNWDRSKGVSLMNPSIYNDNGVLRCNVRLVNYTLHHSEMSKYPHWAGPLQYVHPETDVRLATENYLVDLDENLEVINPRYVDMKLNVPSIWDFHGLEDARVVRWDNKLFLTGVRRDTTDNGQGRMELTEVELTSDSIATELSRTRIPATGDDSSYCEKNWMPIIDKPYHYVKWSNPTEVIRFDPATKTTHVVISGSKAQSVLDVRGGTHVIPYKDYYIAFGHNVRLWKPYAGEKDSEYMAQIIVWDRDFNIIKITDEFKFMNSSIEFQCGLCMDLDNKHMLLSFAEMDNVAYICRFDPDWLLNSILN